jgi:hypothetical protein
MREMMIEEICRIRPHLTAAALAQVSDESLIRMLSSHAARDRRHRYQARVMLDGKRISIGYFKTPEEAQTAVEQAKFRHSIGLPPTQ